MCLYTCFQFLNNITHIFTHAYFQKIQTTLLEQCYQTATNIFSMDNKIIVDYDDDINDQCAGTSTNEVFRVDLEDVQGIW